MIRLSQKEEEVMEHIWQLGECTPRDVLMRYPEPQPLLNGIQNVFQSLERKGYLDGSIKDVVSFFAREQKLSAEELREIINEIEKTHPIL